MPFYWTNINTKYAIMNAAIPASGALVGSLYAANNARIFNFLMNQQYPRNLAPSFQFFHVGMNMATVAPLGYASYLVYKYGGGFDYTDTTVALGLYAATIGTGLLAVPVLNYRNVELLAVYNGLLAALAATTAFAFYKIDNISGYWAIPFSLWTLYFPVAGFLNLSIQKIYDIKVVLEKVWGDLRSMRDDLRSMRDDLRSMRDDLRSMRDDLRSMRDNVADIRRVQSVHTNVLLRITRLLPNPPLPPPPAPPIINGRGRGRRMQNN